MRKQFNKQANNLNKTESTITKKTKTATSTNLNIERDFGFILMLK